MTYLPHDHPYLQLETDAAEVRYEDGGRAAIVEIGGGVGTEEFVRVQSWCPTGEHPFITSLVGRRVRVTIEVLP